LWVLSAELAAYHPSGAWKLVAASRLLGQLCTPAVKYVVMFIISKENQDREERQQKKKLQREREQQNARIKMLQQGKKPRYQTKCEYE
jgi:hypothetical protein